MNIIDLLIAIPLFFILFFIAAPIHELFHYLDAWRRGGNPRIEIWFWNGIPSMRCIYSGKTTMLTDFIGGGGTFIVYLIFGGISYYIYYPLFIAFICNAFAQIFYAFYETIFLHRLDVNTYMRYHYYSYIAGALFGLVLLIIL